MLKLTSAIVAVALAGTASAAGWRSMRLEASDEARFTKSGTAMLEELSPAHRHVLRLALKDIWVQGKERAAANQTEYTAGEFLRQVDGLGYDDIVTLTDPTGDTAKARYRTAALSVPRGSPRTGGSGVADRGQPRGGPGMFRGGRGW